MRLENGSDYLAAPRFLYKFASSAYAPLDKDIVREMWVSGDLKDRLGIRHRKASKNSARMSDLETAPMFREPHARSASELTLSQGYEPTRVQGEKPRGYTGDSMDPDVKEGLPPLIDDLHPDPSPHPSYYSSNDIPIPSPIPPSLYRFTNGEVGEKEGGPSRGASPSSIPPLPVGEAFEMQVRPSQPHSRSGSQGFRHHVPAYSSEDPLPSPYEGGDEIPQHTSWIGGRAL